MQTLSHDKLTSLSTMQRMSMIRAAEAAIAHDPKNADAYKNIGVLLALDKQHGKAIEYFKKASSLRKKDVSILQNLADAYSVMKNYREARKVARKLVELQPKNERFLTFQAEVLDKVGASDQALKVWQKLNRLHPDTPKHLYNMAECLGRLGKISEAQQVYSHILDIEPDHAETLYLVCNSRKHSAEEAKPLLENIPAAIAKTQDTLLKANLNYGGGKVLADLGRYDEAFDYFAEANRLRRPETPVASPNVFRNVRHAFTRQFLKERRDYGLATTQPIFIFGMPRSGTTLTESLCGAHSQVTAGDEQMYIDMLARPLGIHVDNPEVFAEELANVDTEASIRKARQYLESTKTVAGNTPHFTDKMPHNFLRVGLIRLLFPNAKLIHCRRHPIDNCVSLYTNSMMPYHNEYKTDLYNLGLYYRQYVQLMQHWREVLPEPMHEVFYEDMVTNTEANAREMIDYLGLEWEDGVMDRQGSQKSVMTLSSFQVRQPVYTSSAGRWKVYEKHLGPLIEALGPVVEDYEAELAALSASTAAGK